jgi:ATP phosphoribosyltransferase
MASIWESLEGKCIFAVPKKGRLCEKVLPLLTCIDVLYVRKQRLDIAICTTLPNLALVFLPTHDIPLYTSLGRVDMGITGSDLVRETQSKIEVISNLGFGKCRLSIQVPQKDALKDVKDLIGKRVATSFPYCTREYFKSIDPKETTTISTVSGSVEVSCALGLSDAIVDLIETGETMRVAGLEELHCILETEAVFIVNPNSKYKDLAQKISKRLNGVLTAQNFVMVEYNIPRKIFEEVKKITPGKTSPTLSPLDNPDWIAVKVMIPKNQSNKILDELEDVGAKDIVVCAIQNCRTEGHD